MAAPPPQPGKPRRGRIEVDLSSRPKRLYRAAAPPPPITLVPPRDSTAYIVSKLVLFHRGQRRMYYTVSWTDQPAARVSVLATRVLDYVSPRELEDWEYNDFLAREEEKRIAEVEAAKDGGTEKKKVGRKRGRPPKGPRQKAELEAAEEEGIVDSEAEAMLAERNKASAGPSLSTPRKRRPEELLPTDAEETETEEEGVAIMRQLYGEQQLEEEGGVEMGFEGYGEDMDVDSEGLDVLAPPSGEEVSSRASSLAAPLHAKPGRASPGLAEGLKTSSAGSSVVQLGWHAPAYGAVAAAPSIGAQQTSTAALRRAPKPRSRASTPRLSTELRSRSRANTPRVSTHVPPPSTNEPRSLSQVQSELQAPTYGDVAVVPTIGTQQTPTAALRREQKPRSRASTPRFSTHVAPPPTNGADPSQREASGFTPVPVRTPSFKPATLPTLPNVTVAGPSADETNQPPDSAKNRGRKKRKKEKPAEEEGAADEGWEVKRLEGDKYDYDAAGNLVRYFKVRWEGDWPEWQNPSWEPEENISEVLKAEYLAQQESKMKNGYLTGQSPAKKSAGKKPGPAFLPRKRYSNVAEAFEGEINELGDGDPAGRHGEDDDEDMEERIVVTDEPLAGSGPAFSSFDQGLVTYQKRFGSGGS
jgi:hypothetical protein